jgi:hypothetical protein
VVGKRALQGIVCCFGLALALAPVGALADTASDHSQAELANAEAQLQDAQQQADDFATQASLSAANEREIAFMRSEALRQAELNNGADARAIEQIASALAAGIRSAGDANARNELAILQIKADALVAKADDKVANALAIGRADEIANAQAQSAALHQMADYLLGTVAQQNMNNAEVMADDAAAALETSATAEAQNDTAMGDDDLLAADTVLNSADVAAESSILTGEAQGEALLTHAEASLANAEAMAAETP